MDGGGDGWGEEGRRELPYGNVMTRAGRLMVSVAAPVILPLGWRDEWLALSLGKPWAGPVRRRRVAAGGGQTVAEEWEGDEGRFSLAAS